MIRVNITGGLGNQMFQYAIARKYQIQTGQKISLNIHELKNFKLTRSFELDAFNISSDIEVDDSCLPWYAHRRNYINKVLRNISPKNYMSLCGTLFNAGIWYLEEMVELPKLREDKDIILGGYWQSADYFKEIDTDIKKEFTAKEPLKAENFALYNKIQNTESVCVTIRRGDYVTDEHFRKEYFVCDTKYFLKGVKKIKEEIPNAVVFVFSDDVDWVRNNVHFPVEVYYESGNDPVWEKLRLMSACKHFVISNSTFSWWAQHLSANENKIVYAPSRWYPNGRKCSIYEKSWKFIEV